MYFILKSEIDAVNQYYCPYCNLPRIKRLDKKELYNKYICWNKNCEMRDVPFMILTDYISQESSFDINCNSCEEEFERSFVNKDDGLIVLSFKCKSKMCEANADPIQYDLNQGTWVGSNPNIKIFEDHDEKMPKSSRNIESKAIINQEKIGEKDRKLDPPEESISPPPATTAVGLKCSICEIGENPLLTMDKEQYSRFLAHHDGKAIVLVDVPNFVRTLKRLYPREFVKILQKSYALLLRLIDRTFNSLDGYIIRYFSKPDEDLKESNELLMNYCRENQGAEFFHMLQIEKSGHYSDIDNYLIANGIEILERCEIKGFVIVSSDKDYLPVMQIANHKNVRSYIYGVNTSNIYEKYGIKDIRVLGGLNFFDK